MLSFIFGHALKRSFNVRYDGSPQLEYFLASDYGCESKPFSFYSGNNLLRGEKVYCGDLSSITKAMVFFHGVGAGRGAYMREICYFAKKGYLVYCYDNTGCMQSEGRSAGNLAQSSLDADAFFEYLKQDEDYQNKPIDACGHSWGGVACLHCLKEDIPVRRVVAFAGVIDLIELYLTEGHLGAFARKPIQAYLKRAYGKDALHGFRELETAKKPYLYIHGENDELINSLNIYPRISKISKQNPLVSCYLVRKRGHQCYWEEQAQKYFLGIFKKGKFGTPEHDPRCVIDYNRLRDDEVVMQVASDFLSKR